MSNINVRNAFIAELTTLGAIAPFVDTVNRQATPPKGLWMTAEWYVDFDQALCYGGKKRWETGTVDISVFAPPGDGQDAALTAAAQLVEHFKAWKSGAVEVSDIIGAQDIAGGDAEGKDYGVVLSVIYNYFY